MSEEWVYQPGARLTARVHRAQLEQEQRRIVERALAEAEPAARQVVGRHTPGDAQRLRGIPVVGVQGGVGGAIPGTKPGQGLR